MSQTYGTDKLHWYKLLKFKQVHKYLLWKINSILIQS